MANLVLNGRSIDSLDEIAENFVDEDVVKAFENGMLVDWLDEFGYDDEVCKIREITSRENIVDDVVKALGLDASVVESSRRKILNKRAAEKERANAAAKQKEAAKEEVAKVRKEEECIITKWNYTICDSVLSLGGDDFSPAIPKETCGSLSIPSVIDGLQVVEIKGSAFSGCHSLSSVCIPNSVTKIGNGAFSCCSSLKSIKVDSSNTKFTSINGLLLTKDGTRLISCPGGVTTAEIPETVVRIRRMAFWHCEFLKKIALPRNLKVVDDLAFGFCSQLESVTIPSSVGLGSGVFAGCTALTSFKLDEANVTYSIVNELIVKDGCEIVACPGGISSVVIPDNIERIRDYAFRGCSLKNVRIPRSVRSIGWSAFADCNSLSSISFLGDRPAVALEDCDDFSPIFEDSACRVAFVSMSANGWPEHGQSWCGVVIKKI